MRALLVIGFVAVLVSGCGTAPVAEDVDRSQSTDVLYAKAREAYEAGDYFVAAERLIILARRGDPRGQYALGFLYYQGQGVLSDRARAIELFRAAAAQGNPKAIRALAMIEGRAEAEPTPLLPSEVSRRAAPAVADASPESEPASTVVSEMARQSAPEPAASVERESLAPQSAPPEPVVQQLPDEPFSPTWLRRQDGSRFTIQLVAGSARQGLDEFARRHRLADPVGIVETRLDGEPWFVLLYGLFTDLAQAREALSVLPMELRRDRPWIRLLRDIVANLPTP